jgi:hypothetical protein
MPRPVIRLSTLHPTFASQSPCAKSSADDGLVSKHRRFNQNPAIIIRASLPAHASVLCNGTEYRDVCHAAWLSFDYNGCYSRWNNDPCFWVTLGNGVIEDLASYAPSAVIEATSASICSRRFGNSEMSPTSSGVNSAATISCVSASTPRCLASSPAREDAVLPIEPFALAVNLQTGAVDQQMQWLRAVNSLRQDRRPPPRRLSVL